MDPLAATANAIAPDSPARVAEVAPATAALGYYPAVEHRRPEQTLLPGPDRDDLAPRLQGART